jgi:hypothetical protein
LKNFAAGSTTIPQVSSTDYRKKLADTAAKKPRDGEISFPNSSFCLLARPARLPFPFPSSFSRFLLFFALLIGKSFG